MKNALQVFVVLTLATATSAFATPLKDAITAAEQQFGGQAIDAESYNDDGLDVVEVDVLVGNVIIEAIYSADTIALLESDQLTRRFRVSLASRGLDLARLSLLEAIDVAEEAADGEAVEAELILRARKPRMNGRRYNVDVVSNGDEFDVILNSRSSQIIRIQLED